MRRTVLRGALAAALLLAASSSIAQQWPSRPIKWIMPYQAGSSPDVTVRVVAHAMSEILKQPIVVDNKPGAAGNLGAQIAANSPADGYTWVYSAVPMAGNMKMYKAPGYDVLKDFTHVSQIASADTLLVVHPDSGLDSVKTLLERARRHPGKLTYASGGVGTPAHLGAELMLRAAEVAALHVPYKGAAAAVSAVLMKEVDFSLPVFGVALPEVHSGKLRALAVLGAKRNTKLPNVPTLAEAGLPGVTLESFGGLSVPAGTPEPIVARIHDALRQALERPDVRAKLEARGSTNIGASTPAQYTERLMAELASTERMMRAAALEPQ